MNPYCILIWIFLFSFCFSLYLAMQEGVRKIRKLHQIPCTRCAFFTGDYRLKCTVHPCKALSEEALNCRDYEPNCSCTRKGFMGSMGK